MAIHTRKETRTRRPAKQDAHGSSHHFQARRSVTPDRGSEEPKEKKIVQESRAHAPISPRYVPGHPLGRDPQSDLPDLPDLPGQAYGAV